MREEIRRAIAFAVLAPEDGNKDCEIYSYDKDRRSKFTGNSNDFLDYDMGARVTRFGPDLYHYGHWQYVSLEVGAKSFSGYDHAAKCHFEGTVKGPDRPALRSQRVALFRLRSGLTRSDTVLRLFLSLLSLSLFIAGCGGPESGTPRFAICWSTRASMTAGPARRRAGALRR
jgi:hypothetical protein